MEATADPNGTPLPWPDVLDGPTTGSQHWWTGPGAARPRRDVRQRHPLPDALRRQRPTRHLVARAPPDQWSNPAEWAARANFVRALPESVDSDQRNQFDTIHGIRQDPEAGNSTLRRYANSKKGRVALYGARGAWWTGIGFLVYENADTWIRRTRLFDR